MKTYGRVHRFWRTWLERYLEDLSAEEPPPAPLQWRTTDGTTRCVRCGRPAPFQGISTTTAGLVVACRSCRPPVLEVLVELLPDDRLRRVPAAGRLPQFVEG